MVASILADHQVFALLTAFFFGVGPIVSKRGLAAGGTWMGNSILMVASRTGIFWVVLLLTGGIGSAVAALGPTGVIAFGVAGILGSGLGRIHFYIGVDRVGSSLSSAFTNTRPLFAVLLAIGWLGEAVTPTMAVGVVILVIGLGILSVARGGDISGWRRGDLLFPLAAAVVFALGNVIRRFGLTATPATVVQGIAIGEATALVAVLAYARASGRTEIMRAPRPVIALFLAAAWSPVSDSSRSSKHLIGGQYRSSIPSLPRLRCSRSRSRPFSCAIRSGLPGGWGWASCWR